MPNETVELFKLALTVLEDKINKYNETEMKYFELLRDFIKFFIENFETYESHCKYSMPIISGGTLEFRIRSLEGDHKKIFDLFTIIGVIVWEKKLVSKEYYGNEADIARLFSSSNNDLSRKDQDYIEYIKNSILLYWARVGNEDYVSRAENINKKIEEKINSISSIYENWEKELHRLEDISKNRRSNLNFVGLSAGYQDLLNNKRQEMIIYSASMAIFFALIFSTPLFIPSLMQAMGYVVYDNTNPTSGLVFWSNLTSRLAVCAPFFLIFLYAFRISLRNFQSVRAQIVQLQIRQAVCQFIEAYSDFVRRQPVKDTEKIDHLKKFESLIFSGLTPDPDSVPSTFDGFDQLVEAAKAIRGK